MKLIRNICGLVLVMVTVLAPLAEAVHCDGEHEDACATQCACACHFISAMAIHNEASYTGNPDTGYSHFENSINPGRLFSTDIFRPPART